MHLVHNIINSATKWNETPRDANKTTKVHFLPDNTIIKLIRLYVRQHESMLYIVTQTSEMSLRPN